MNYQKLEQASELYMKLNAVNEQIAGLEKIAMQKRQIKKGLKERIEALNLV